MKFDAAQITKLARDMGFPADSLEKVLCLRELLAELHKHPFLEGKLVLKGGTALNLFYLDLARLLCIIPRRPLFHRTLPLARRPRCPRTNMNSAIHPFEARSRHDEGPGTFRPRRK